MAFWQFKLIVTCIIMTSLTLAQRIAGLTDKNYFVIKLLNYEEEDTLQSPPELDMRNDCSYH